MRTRPVLWISLGIAGLFVLWGVVGPRHLEDVAGRAFAWITTRLGGFYFYSVFAFLLFSLWMALGPYGRVKLGKPEDRPEFSTPAWFAMLFTAGMAIGLVFWGVAEPITHFARPPEGIAPRSPEAARAAMRYSFFHWGLHPWATYTVVGLAVAYAQFRKGESGLISATFRPLLGPRVDGPVGMGIDVFAILATTFGVAASLGLGTMQINGGLSALFGLPNTTAIQLLIIAAVMLIYTASALSGLDRGIRYLSHGDLMLSLGLVLFVLVAGPTGAIFKSWAAGLAGYVTHLVPMSVGAERARGNWTVFYWAWWIAWAPAVGVFIARISRGRTIREFVAGVLAAPTALSLLWFAVFGGSALWLETEGRKGIAAAVERDVTSAFFAALQHFPLGGALGVAATLLIVIAFVTSADSTTFVLGMFSSGGDMNPAPRLRLVWGILQGAIAATLLVSGGLRGAETACLVAALPFTAVMLLMAAALQKALWEERRRGSAGPS